MQKTLDDYSVLRVQAHAQRKCKSGDNGKEVPPVPIPNTAVKLFRVEDTWRATARKIRSSPEFLHEAKAPAERLGPLCVRGKGIIYNKVVDSDCFLCYIIT